MLTEKKPSLGQVVWKYYTFAGISLLSVCLLLFSMNLACFIGLKIRDDYRSQYPLTPSFFQYLKAAYPSNYTDQDIKALWKEFYGRPFAYAPYVQFREKPFKGNYLNVSQHGYRHSGRSQPWPPDPNAFNIFVFGGSTTFGLNVADHETIASYLEQLLNSRENLGKICVYNFGQQAYISGQERALLEQLLIQGDTPNMVIFIDGLNDFAVETPRFTEALTILMNHPIALPLWQLPLSRCLRGTQRALMKRVYKKFFPEKPVAVLEERTQAAIQRYLNNKKITEGICAAHSIQPVFVWQPISVYQFDLKYHSLLREAALRSEDYARITTGFKRMNEYVLTHNMGNDFLWLADMLKEEKKLLFVDSGHYSPELNQKIAVKINSFISTKIK